MYVASDSHSDLPVFLLLERTSRHDMPSFLHSFCTMKAYLPQLRIKKLLLDSAHNAYAVYKYCHGKTSHPLSIWIRGILDISPIKMISPSMKTASPSVRWAYVCTRMVMKPPNTVLNTGPKADWKRGCFCEPPCSPAKYGRTVHVFTDDNPRLFNIPPRDSKAWEKEYDGRSSVEHSNKHEKRTIY